MLIEQEKRPARVRFRHPIRVVTLDGQPRVLRTLTANVSRKGLFLRMPQPLPNGTKVALSLEAGGRALALAQAEVMWGRVAESQLPGRFPGCGVRFTEFMHPRAQELVDYLVQNLDRGRPLTLPKKRPLWARVRVPAAAAMVALFVGILAIPALSQWLADPLDSARTEPEAVVEAVPVAAPPEPAPDVDAVAVAAPAEPEAVVEALPVAAPTEAEPEPVPAADSVAVAAPAEPEPRVQAPPAAAPTEPEPAGKAMAVAGPPASPPAVNAVAVAAPREPEPAVKAVAVAAPREPEPAVAVAAPRESEPAVKAVAVAAPAPGHSVAPVAARTEPEPAVDAVAAPAPAPVAARTEPEPAVDAVAAPAPAPGGARTAQEPVVGAPPPPARKPAVAAQSKSGARRGEVKLPTGAAPRLSWTVTGTELRLAPALSGQAHVTRAFVLEGPPRVVFDVSGAAPTKSLTVPASPPYATAVRLGKQGNGTRIVIDLDTAPKRSRQDDGALVLSF